MTAITGSLREGPLHPGGTAKRAFVLSASTSAENAPRADRGAQQLADAVGRAAVDLGVSVGDLLALIARRVVSERPTVVREVSAVEIEEFDALELATRRFGEEARARVIHAVLDAVSRAPSEGALSEAEDAFLAEHGGLAEHDTAVRPSAVGARFAEHVAEQAAVDVQRFVPAARVAQLLGISESRVRGRKKAGDLIGYSDGRRTVFPLWQFRNSGDGVEVRPQAARIAEAVPEMLPAELAGRMVTRQESLTRAGAALTPVQWLDAGGTLDAVLDVLVDDQVW